MRSRVAVLFLAALVPYSDVLFATPQGDDPPAGKEIDVEIAPGTRVRFCWIPKATATLGSPAAEEYRGDDEKEHEYACKGFWLGKYEVTQGEWAGAMGGANPSQFVPNEEKVKKAGITDTKRLPVDSVSWNDIQPFLKKVNDRPGAGKSFGRAGRFALPHEDEWEYACRGGVGNKHPYHWGGEADGPRAYCNWRYPVGMTERGLGRTCAVDDEGLGYPKHPWGLCHMHGNVWEWCENRYESGTGRKSFWPAVRGGSWGDYAKDCRAAYRSDVANAGRYSNGGFRLAFRPDK